MTRSGELVGPVIRGLESFVAHGLRLASGHGCDRHITPYPPGPFPYAVESHRGPWGGRSAYRYVGRADALTIEVGPEVVAAMVERCPCGEPARFRMDRAAGYFGCEACAEWSDGNVVGPLDPLGGAA